MLALLTALVRYTPHRGAVNVAQAVGVSLVAVLCIVLGTYTASAGEWNKSHKSLAYYYINDIKEFKCFDKIISRESRWNYRANNPHSSAYGLGQMLGEKSKDAFQQIVRSVAYGHHRYGTLCKAKAFHDRKGWW